MTGPLADALAIAVLAAFAVTMTAHCIRRARSRTRYDLAENGERHE